MSDAPDVVGEIIRQWHHERPDLDPSPIGVFGRLTRTYQLKQVRLRSLLGQFDLTPATFDVLANLRRTQSEGPKTAGAIASSSLLSTGGTTFRLDRLEERGLIRRTTATEDRRIVHVELTPKGADLIDAVMTAHLDHEVTLLAGLTATEVQQLAKLLARLEKSVAATPEALPTYDDVDLPPA